MISSFFLDHVPSVVIALSIFAVMLLFNYAGIKVGLWRFKNTSRKNIEEIDATEGGLLGLLALLLAFTFGASNTRHDKRFEAFIKEADDISIVILRADLYPDSIRTIFRQDFSDYVEARIAFYEVGFEQEKILAAIEKSNNISKRIWDRAVLLAKDKENIIASNQMLPGLNTMFVNAKEQSALTNARVPALILWMLFILCFVSSFIFGYGLRTKIDWIVIYGYSLMISLCIYVILDLDRPRGGLITMEKAQQEIVELRKMFIK
jgi:hypothetical protein